MYKATNCNQCSWFMMKAPAGVFFSMRKLLCSECVFAADKIGEDYLINETEYAG